MKKMALSNEETSEFVFFTLYKDEDYKDFFACIDDFYNGGYPYKEYLNRDYLRRLVENKDLIITLAKDINGRVVGTSAALRMCGRFAGSVLLLLRSVIHDMRGKGIGKRQENFLLDQIHQCFPDTLSLYADVMTHDDISQTTMLHNGFSFCGFRMALYRNEIIVPSLPYESGTKMTQAIYCKNNFMITERALFCPVEHHETLAAMYTSLGISVKFQADEMTGDGVGSYQIETSELHKKTELFVDRHGCTEKFSGEINGLISSGYTAVAYINMSLGGCTDTYKALTDLGFYFSGVKPLSANGEYMVLSHSRQCKLILDDIRIPTDILPLYRAIIKEIKK